MRYQIVQFPVVHVHLILDSGDVISIPCDEANTDYQEYLKWVAEGNVAEEFS